MLIPMFLALVIMASAGALGLRYGYQLGRRSAFRYTLETMERVKGMTDDELRDSMPAKGGE